MAPMPHPVAQPADEQRPAELLVRVALTGGGADAGSEIPRVLRVGVIAEIGAACLVEAGGVGAARAAVQLERPDGRGAGSGSR
jgi:hypothetical protein